jgi:hypothetical protein
MLLGAEKPASLEVVSDANGFIANFWRAVKCQPSKVAEWADYPVSHIDLGARHRWLMAQIDRLSSDMQDADWPGDAKCAGWWLWGQCAWIGSGWCDWYRDNTLAAERDPIPHISNAGGGINAIGKIPHISDAGRGLLTSGGRAAWGWLHKLAARLERVRVLHGDWSRCLNTKFGTEAGGTCAVFLDPPYKAYEAIYGGARPVAEECEEWARLNQRLRIALCGHVGDYDLPGWDAWQWSRGSPTFGSTKTKHWECIWFSPACLPRAMADLFASPLAIDPEEMRVAAAFEEPDNA